MRYGNLNAKHNAKFILMDASGRNMLSLERGEDGQFVKADIFDRPVSFSQETLVEVESPEEALSASLNLYGGVNLPYMESLCDLPQAEMLEALKGRVFYNPLAEGYEIADRFIAGNVVQKVADVEGWIRARDTQCCRRRRSHWRLCARMCPNKSPSRTWTSTSGSVGYPRACMPPT